MKKRSGWECAVWRFVVSPVQPGGSQLETRQVIDGQQRLTTLQDLASLLPELAALARTTTRLHPRLGTPSVFESSSASLPKILVSETVSAFIYASPLGR